ncbi:MAG: tRNA epoxyqueuosine(34) reductase QueG [Alphaproteobacteria bacterium]|nr:tRNA epoxyqueuosine(34) reductase QueG [Alphaproteobacteria bacterium]
MSRSNPNNDIKPALVAEAQRLGFDDVRIAKASVHDDVSKNFDAFIVGEYYGDMAWMAEKADRRRTPQALWPEVRSVISVAVNYGSAVDPLALLDQPDRGAISVYARGRDYHDILKKRLKNLARWLVERSDEADVKVFVDTAPVLEKPLAESAGLGWQGKHTNLVSRKFGSWLFLGEVFTTLDLSPDEPEQDHCGSCTKCLDICPTNAFLDARRLDARRCISYLTIEHKGHIPVELRSLMGNRIYGCDDCLAICPWNKFAEVAAATVLNPRIELEAPQLADLVQLDDAAFRTLFSGSPIKRIGRDRFVRNVLIAIGNSGVSDLDRFVEPLCDDESPLVRAMAIWALSRISLARAVNRREIDMGQESDLDVRCEWAAF